MTALRSFVTFALALTACAASFEAAAAYSCTFNITPAAISTVYSPTVVTHNDSVLTWTMNCSRTPPSDNTMNYTVIADNGLWAGGGSFTQNQVDLGGNRYNYELYRNTTCTGTPWGTSGFTDFSGTLNFGASSTASLTVPFCLRVFGGQPVVLPAGSYTDTVNITLDPAGSGAANAVTSPLSVTVITINWCQITVPPGNVNFTYTSFQAAPAVATSTYGVRCTFNFAYAMSLDGIQPYNLLGLDYTLSVPASSIGTGLTQTHTINGSIAAGQSGTCGTAVCNGTQTRTLTIAW